MIALVLLTPFLPLSFHQRREDKIPFTASTVCTVCMIVGENCLLIFTFNVLINVEWGKEKLHHAAEIEEAPMTSSA